MKNWSTIKHSQELEWVSYFKWSRRFFFLPFEFYSIFPPEPHGLFRIVGPGTWKTLMLIFLGGAKFLDGCAGLFIRWIINTVNNILYHSVSFISPCTSRWALWVPLNANVDAGEYFAFGSFLFQHDDTLMHQSSSTKSSFFSSWRRT